MSDEREIPLACACRLAARATSESTVIVSLVFISQLPDKYVPLITRTYNLLARLVAAIKEEERDR